MNRQKTGSLYCTIPDADMTKFCETILKGFRVMNPESRVDVRVVTNVDGQTDEQTDEWTENWISILRHT